MATLFSKYPLPRFGNEDEQQRVYLSKVLGNVHDVLAGGTIGPQGPQGPQGVQGPQGPTGPTGHGSTTTTAAPSASGGNWLFTVGDTTAFNAASLPIFCGDGTNSIYGTVVSVINPTQITVAPTTTTGTVTSISNGSTFTFSGVAGPTGPAGGGGASIAQIRTISALRGF